jgi:dipeptidyl aminopeptidase/acylaminoacyl peptidase
VNVYTGAAENFVRGRANTVGWDLKDGKPVLRYDSNRRGTELAVYGCKDARCRDLSLVVRSRRQDNTQDWQYAGDAPGAGMIFVRGRTDGSDTDNIYRFDLRTRTPVEVVAKTQGYDMSTVFQINGEYLGAGYVADTLMFVLKDRKLQGHWNGMRNYFQRQANVRIVDLDRAHARLLVHVTGPQAPGDYYLYDVVGAQLRFVASDRPWLDPERLATVEVVKTTTRDGTAITSYLTHTAGNAGPRPLIVMPHGGPELRDSIDFEPLVQAFAAQGWLVLQPNFRGSSGYGHAFAEAGHRQWARRMQDDVTDAVNDLVHRGVADPKRMAIYGSSYGGYAALCAAVVTPDLYRGAVSVSGLSDLRDFLDYVRTEDGADSQTYRSWLGTIGDPQADKAAIDVVSPRYRAADIRIPVLLMHGRKDAIVPVRQSEAMKQALEKAGKTVEFVAFDDEGHRDWSTANQLAQIHRAIEFLRPLLE